MANHYDVLIIGGGVVGLTAALAMAEHDLSIAIIDKGEFQEESFAANSRVYAINEASKELFSMLKIWPSMIEQNPSPYEKMHIWDETNDAYIDFDSRYLAKPQLGFIVQEVVIKNSLYTAINSNSRITCLANRTIDSLNQNQPLEVKSGSECWTADLVLVADGAESVSRHKLGVPVTRWPYHQEALIATVTTEFDHNKTAFQIFNTTGTLAFLPLSNPNQSSIVWSTSPQHAQSLMKLSVDEFGKAITTAFGKQLGQVELLQPLRRFPLIMRQASQYVGANWALLGDAAHTIHPMAGLGLNLGLGDVRSFLALYNEPSLSIKSKLRRYQRQRKYASWQVIAFLESLKLIFLNPLKPSSIIRGIALRSGNALLLIKKQWIRYAQRI